VEQSGSRRNVRSNVDLRINQKLTLDFALEIGAASETVTVAGQTPVVGSSATLALWLASGRLWTFPLNGPVTMPIGVPDPRRYTRPAPFE